MRYSRYSSPPKKNGFKYEVKYLHIMLSGANIENAFYNKLKMHIQLYFFIIEKIDKKRLSGAKIKNAFYNKLKMHRKDLCF
jgi:hypothetical protein